MAPGEAAHEDHFATCTLEVSRRLAAIQAEVERRVPGATRCVAYGMPAFRRGKVFFYFAGFKRHIGIYPPVTAPAGLVARLGPCRGPKGNLSFAHGAPLPLDLIGEVAEALAATYGGRAGK